MFNILMLTFANLRKSKSQTVSLFVFVLIAAMLLNIGITMFTGISDFFDRRVEETGAEHFMAVWSTAGFSTDEQERYIADYPGVIESCTQEAVGGTGNYIINDVKNMGYMYFTRHDETQPMGKPFLIGDSLPLTGDAVYIPYFMTLNGDYKLGDKFNPDLLGVDLTFTVAGSTEELMMGAQMNSVYRLYVSDEKYDELLNQFPDGKCALIMARLENKDDALFLDADFAKDVSMDGMAFFININSGKMTRTLVTTIVLLVIAAFALILLLVSLIVIRFRIVNSIEESMANIGALKSIGYRNRQIVASVAGQFVVTALIGGIAGAALSYAALPAITGMLRPLFALEWNPGFELSTALIPVLLILFAVAVTAFLSARRINKLHPLIALRGGITTHSFKSNPFPLHKTRVGLNVSLALKQLFQTKKQAVTISVIVAAVTMAAVAGIAVNYNLNEKRDFFARSLFGEIPEVNFLLKEGADGEAFKQKMADSSEVRKVFGFYSMATVLVDEITVMSAYAEDCSLMESYILFKGRYPKHDNEIALGPNVLKVAGKKIGDSVSVKIGETEKDYLVVGTVQYMNNGGFNGIMTAGGLARISPDSVRSAYNVYLYDTGDVAGFISSVKANEGDIFDHIINMDDQVGSMLGTMGDVFAAVAMGILAVTAFVIILTLYMIIKTAILRRKRELGIQKAVGFTTFQLMNQIAVSLTPAVLLGIAAGAAAGYFGFNPMLTVMLSSMGVVKAGLPAPLGQTVIVCMGLVALAYCVSMLIAYRIRKISAYTLVSE